MTRPLDEIRQARNAARLVMVEASNANMRAEADRTAQMEQGGLLVVRREDAAVLMLGKFEVIRSAVHGFYPNAIADLYAKWLSTPNVLAAHAAIADAVKTLKDIGVIRE
jgi:hypothetical protein